ncbi:MAG: hypothetical protein Q9221_002921 [Calogaya cf. arnoldii]
MPHRSDRDWDYGIFIFGIPRVVAQQENSWKVVKDVVRNLIDGQPKKVELKEPSFWCGFQSLDDAIQALEALAGRTWCGRVAMQLQSTRSTWKTSQHGLSYSNLFHVFDFVVYVESNSSEFNTLWPVTTKRLPATVLHPNPGEPTMPLYGYNVANSVGFGPTSPVNVGASVTGHNPAHGSSPRATTQNREVIVQNLYVGVKEHWLKDFFTKSVGPVQECRIKERGEKKRHALVSFTHAEHAQAAIKRYNEQPIEGRKVSVRLTKEVQEGPVIIDGSGIYG